MAAPSLEHAKHYIKRIYKSMIGKQMEMANNMMYFTKYKGLKEAEKA
jgi:hypothetical protein